MNSFLLMLVNVVQILLDVASFIIVAQFVLSILIAFNVVSRHSDFVDSLWRALAAVTDPIYRPIRRILPDTGTIDFSPMVVLIIIRILSQAVLPWLVGLIYGQ